MLTALDQMRSLFAVVHGSADRVEFFARPTNRTESIAGAVQSEEDRERFEKIRTD